MIGDDYAQAGLATLTLEMKVASLPGVKRL